MVFSSTLKPGLANESIWPKTLPAPTKRHVSTHAKKRQWLARLAVGQAAARSCPFELRGCQAALELAFKERATGEPAQIPVSKHPQFIPNEDVGTSTHELNAPNQIKQVGRTGWETHQRMQPRMRVPSHLVVNQAALGMDNGRLTNLETCPNYMNKSGKDQILMQHPVDALSRQNWTSHFNFNRAPHDSHYTSSQIERPYAIGCANEPPTRHDFHFSPSGSSQQTEINLRPRSKHGSAQFSFRDNQLPQIMSQSAVLGQPPLIDTYTNIGSTTNEGWNTQDLTKTQISMGNFGPTIGNKHKAKVVAWSSELSAARGKHLMFGSTSAMPGFINRREIGTSGRSSCNF